MIKIKILAKVILIVLLILCFYPMPYAYYPAQRMASFILFVLIAYIDGTSTNYISFVIALFGALLFNPFIKPGFTGPTWDNVDRWLIGIINVWVLIDVYKVLNISGGKNANTRILRYLKLNDITGKYEVYDGGYKYEISPDLIEDLHVYMHQSRIGLLGDWYNRLTKEEKEKVRKTLRFNQ